MSGSGALAAAFATRSNAELAGAYREWARSYEADNAALGYRLPFMVAAFFARHVPRETTPVLDAGCGTGLAGNTLRALGYTGIVGIDLSEPMLAHAASRGDYAALHPMTLGAPLDFADASFGAVISAGVFTAGHAPASSLDELVRITRPNGWLVFSVRADLVEKGGFRNRLDALANAGRCRIVETSAAFCPFTVGEQDVVAVVFVVSVG